MAKKITQLDVIKMVMVKLRLSDEEQGKIYC